MPKPLIKVILCECCGKFIKTEKFGDLLTLEDFSRLTKLKRRKICWKCKLLRKTDH